jgi:hypothetical protein
MVDDNRDGGGDSVDGCDRGKIVKKFGKRWGADVFSIFLPFNKKIRVITIKLIEKYS